jgi:uncharacterized membrane protein YeaQ/YmgE (transglycosylase-associated protein family)
MFVTSVLMGVLAGALAGLLMKRGSLGLEKDIILGLMGSVGLSWLLRAIETISGSGMLVTAFVALLGAGFAIVAQRTLRPAERLGGTARRIRPIRSSSSPVASVSIQGKRPPNRWTWTSPPRR